MLLRPKVYLIGLTQRLLHFKGVVQRVDSPLECEVGEAVREYPRARRQGAAHRAWLEERLNQTNRAEGKPQARKETILDTISSFIDTYFRRRKKEEKKRRRWCASGGNLFAGPGVGGNSDEEDESGMG